MTRTEFQSFAHQALQAAWVTELLARVKGSARQHLLAEGFSVRADVDVTLTGDDRVRRLFGLTVAGPDDLVMDVVARVNLRYSDGTPKPDCWLRLSARTYSQQRAADEFLPGWHLLDKTVFECPLYVAGDVSAAEADRTFRVRLDGVLGKKSVFDKKQLTQEFCRQALEALAP
jgi:hypothetical protein